VTPGTTASPTATATAGAPAASPTATPTATPRRERRDPADLSANDDRDVNRDPAYGRDARFAGVHDRGQGIATSHGGSSIGRPSNGDEVAVANAVPAGAADFAYTVVVGNRNPRAEGDAPAPNRVVVDLPAGLTAAGLTIEATTCRGVGRWVDPEGVYHEAYCTEAGSDDEWRPVPYWRLVISDVDGRQRLDIKDLPAVRWGQRVRFTILTSPVPATSGGAARLALDAWVEPARNEGGSCERAETGCPPEDVRANNSQRFVTRIGAPGGAGASAGARAPASGRRALVW
jgi:hypothetical protein